MKLKPNVQAGQRDLSLIEIMIATVILAIAMLGIAASFHTAQAAHTSARERQAAMSAAADQLQSALTIAYTDWATFSAKGAATPPIESFHVVLLNDVSEAAPASSTPPAGAMRPAPTSAPFWPADYTNSSTAVLHPGLVEYVVINEDLVDVRVTVGWRTPRGGFDHVTLTQRIFNPEL